MEFYHRERPVVLMGSSHVLLTSFIDLIMGIIMLKLKSAMREVGVLLSPQIPHLQCE